MARTMLNIDIFTGNSPLVRVMIAGCVFAILGSAASARAQIPEACMAGWCSGIGSGSQLTPPSYSYSSNYDPGAFRRIHPEVDTPENRQAANRIYQITFAGINKALTSKGKVNALEVSQHPERNPELLAFIESESEDKYILLERLIASSISDGKLYISADHIVNVHSMSDLRWKELTAKAQVDVDAKAADTSQVDYLKNCTESPNCYGPTDERVAKLLLSVYQVKQEKLRVANEAAEAVRRAAEAARQEQARIAQEKAAEEARIARDQAQQTKLSLFSFMKVPQGSQPTLKTTNTGDEELLFQTTSQAQAFQVGTAQSLGTYVQCGLEEKLCEMWTATKAGDEIHLPSGIRCGVLLSKNSGPATMIGGEPFVEATCYNVPINGGGSFEFLTFLMRPGSLK